MIATNEDLVRELRALGMTVGDPVSVSPEPPASVRPWYIGLLLGASGWIAGLFVMIFVFLLFKPTGAGALIVGLALLGAAWGLFAVDREGAFTSQLALALSVAGQIAVFFGAYEVLFKSSRSLAGMAFVALVLQLALIAAMPSHMHRTMSTLFACAAWALFVRYSLWDQPVLSGAASNVRSIPIALALVGWAIVWLSVGGALYALIRREPAWMAAGWQTILRPISIGLVIGLAVATLLSHPFDSFSWITGGQQRESGLALWPLLSAFASLGGLMAAVALGSPGLTAVCLVAALLHVSHFYYTMGISLLAKSLTMLLLGALLLAAARYMTRSRSP